MAIDMCEVNPGIIEKPNKISNNNACIKSQKNAWDFVFGKYKTSELLSKVPQLVVVYL